MDIISSKSGHSKADQIGKSHTFSNNFTTSNNKNVKLAKIELLDTKVDKKSSKIK